MAGTKAGGVRIAAGPDTVRMGVAKEKAAR